MDDTPNKAETFQYIPGKQFFIRTRGCGKHTYRTRAIISRSQFQVALIYKPRILSLKKWRISIFST